MANYPKLALYHANGKGTGCAMKMELHPLKIGDLESGAIYARLASQKTLGDRRKDPPEYPTFDWDNSVTVRLDFDDLAKMVQVFRGETESIEDDKGLFHRYANKCQVIKFRHMIEPVCGYSLEVYETSTEDGSESRTYIFLSTAEALGLSLAIENSFGQIAFGVPICDEIPVGACSR